MKPKTLFTLTAVIMCAFGSGFVLLPEFVFSLFGVSLDAGGLMLAHVAGAAVFALGVLGWVFRNSSAHDAVRAAATALLSFFLIKSIVTLLAQLAGVFNVLGWSIVALDGLFVLGYVYLLFVRGPATDKAGP